MTDKVRRFPTATSLDNGWRAAAIAVADGLGQPQGGVGILYAAESFSEHLGGMVEILQDRTGISDWAVAAGYGVITTEAEHFGVSSATAMVLEIPEDGYRLFAGDTEAGRDLESAHRNWITDATMPVAITHVDPRHPDAAQSLSELVEHTAGFLVGGLTAAAGDHPHSAGGRTGCLSGVAVSPTIVEVATALSQGCTPLGKAHTVTSARDNILIELDGQPALDVFKADIGEDLSNDLRRVGGLIFAALPVTGSDTADYTVRNLIGIDPDHKVIAIAESVSEGNPVLFCRRDRATAVTDMRRMTADLKRRVAARPIRGGLYISCAGRGPNQFAEPEREIDIIRETLGTFPMAGFFANGEISRDRIYAYTGVLTLFL